MNNNYQKALEKVKKAQEKYGVNCCCQIIYPNLQVGPTGPKGDIGPTGPEGLMGPTGPAGTSVTIMGSYDNLNDLINSHPKGSSGDGYLVDNDLYVWVDNENMWVDVGTIKGPKGDLGPTGPTGPKGLDGANGPTGPEGPIGAATLQAYGGKYNNLRTTLDMEGAGKWNVVPLTEEMANINVINSITNAIKLEQDGIYELNYFLNFSSDKDTSITSIIRENGVMIPETTITKNVFVNKITSFYLSTIVKLLAGDTLDINLSATIDNVLITSSFCLKKIDEIE